MDAPYFDLKASKRDSALGFLVESVLKSRIKMGLKQDPANPDEDVNIYLAFLLLEASLPTFRERMARYASRRNSDVFQMIQDSQENSLKYLVYKTNGDHLLFSLGILQQVTAGTAPESAFFEKTRHSYEGYARTYYQFASEYNCLIHRRVTALAVVLHKLSHDFERYEQVLSHLREDYLTFLSQNQEEGFARFLKELDQFEGELTLRERQDRFLDTYLQYQRTKDPALKETLALLAKEIQTLDPTFRPPGF